MKKLPDGWVINLFEECIEKEIAANKLKIPQNGFQVKGKYPIIDQGVEYIAGFTDDSSKVYKGELPVIIFGDHTRIFKFVDFPFALGADGTKILVPKKILYPKYFYFFLNGLIIENHGYSRHYKFLKDKQIVIPPLPTQKKIAAVLEKAEKLREWRKEADGLTDRFLKSTFLEMFGDTVDNPKGWEVMGLGAICSEIYRYPTFYGFEYSKNGIPVIRINNIFSNGSLDPDVSNYVFIEPNLNKNFPRTILEFNDIVMAVRGDGSTAKRIGLVNTINLVGANISPNLIRFKANTVILNPLYLFNLMTSYSGQKLLEKYVTRTAKKTITAKDIKEIPIPLPPLPLQQKFASIVQQVEQIREHQTLSRQHIENFFNVLMQRAFSGELEAK